MQQGSTYRLSERQAFFGQALLNMCVSKREIIEIARFLAYIVIYQIQVKQPKLDRSKSYRRSKQA